VEFLNIKVLEHEKLLNQFEMKCRSLEEEKVQMEAQCKNDIEHSKAETKLEIDSLSIQCAK
jgi:hypothetical protein